MADQQAKDHPPTLGKQRGNQGFRRYDCSRIEVNCTQKGNACKPAWRCVNRRLIQIARDATGALQE
jgi:hypothetical protein